MFLSNKNYRYEVEKLFVNEKPIKIAVSFWGRGALNLFVNYKNSKVDIICNLESGACNPDVINKLMALDNVEIRTNKRLHAKVILQDNVSIIGSANISSNGLDLDYDGNGFWEEAGVLVNDKNEIDDGFGWFNGLWNNSSIIDNKILDDAKEKWHKRDSATRFGPGKGSIFDAIKKNNDKFLDKNIFIVMYKDAGTHSDAEEAIKQTVGSVQGVSYYLDWEEIPDNSYLLDVYVGKNGGVEFLGYYKTSRDSQLLRFKYENGEDGVIKFCDKVKDINGYKLTTENNNLIKKYKNELFAYDKDPDTSVIPLYEAIKIMCD